MGLKEQTWRTKNLQIILLTLLKIHLKVDRTAVVLVLIQQVGLESEEQFELTMKDPKDPGSAHPGSGV